MSYKTIEVHPLTPTLGAEVVGINLGESLSDRQFQEVHDALMTHQVIFFQGQNITLEQHKDFGRRFGPLHIHPSAPGPEGHPEILRIHADANSKQVAGHRWHSDVSCDPEPPMGSILHIHTVPSVGGDTLFASSNAAYEALSEPMKTFLGGLTARHDGSPNYNRRAKINGKAGDEQFPFADHPVIRTHPVTGKKGIYVSPVFTQYICDLPEDESKSILEFLYAHNRKEQFVCRFSWKKDSVAFWDNRAVQHLAMWDYFPEVRSGYRVTVAGDKPF